MNWIASGKRCSIHEVGRSVAVAIQYSCQPGAPIDIGIYLGLQKPLSLDISNPCHKAQSNASLLWIELNRHVERMRAKVAALP